MHRAARVSALGLFAFVAGAPFALAVCAPHEPAVVAPVESASPPPKESAIADVPTAPPAAEPPPPVASVSAAPPPPDPPPPPYRGPIPKDCREIERAANATFSEGSCKQDSDCTTGGGYCSCGAPIAKSMKPKLDALNDAFSKQSCAMIGPPRPCPTCAPPPPRICRGGKCR